jgi:hypothetical protein
MRFTFAATATLFGAALAAPQAGMPETRETVRITDFFAHKSGASASAAGKVDSISFKMHSSRIASDAGVSCTATAAEGEDSIKFKPEYYNCDGAKDNDRYAFEVISVKDQSVFELYIIHQTAVAYVTCFPLFADRT